MPLIAKVSLNTFDRIFPISEGSSSSKVSPKEPEFRLKRSSGICSSGGGVLISDDEEVSGRSSGSQYSWLSSVLARGLQNVTDAFRYLLTKS
jgi:hypothetical protein